MNTTLLSHSRALDRERRPRTRCAAQAAWTARDTIIMSTRRRCAPPWRGGPTTSKIWWRRRAWRYCASRARAAQINHQPTPAGRAVLCSPSRAAVRVRIGQGNESYALLRRPVDLAEQGRPTLSLPSTERPARQPSRRPAPKTQLLAERVRCWWGAETDHVLAITPQMLDGCRLVVRVLRDQLTGKRLAGCAVAARPIVAGLRQRPRARARSRDPPNRR